MKVLEERITRKSEKAAIVILLAFLLASILSALGIVYVLNYLLTGTAE